MLCIYRHTCPRQQVSWWRRQGRGRWCRGWPTGREHQRNFQPRTASIINIFQESEASSLDHFVRQFVITFFCHISIDFNIIINIMIRTELEKAVWNCVAKHPPEENPDTLIVSDRTFALPASNINDYVRN